MSTGLRQRAAAPLRRQRPIRSAVLCCALVLPFAVEAAHPDADRAYADLDLAALMEVPIDTVYGASRYMQKLAQAPASISIITADEIRRHGHRTLADVLRSVRGIHVTYDRNYETFGMRGFAPPGDYNTRVLLLVDGHRINDNLYNSALIGTEAVIDVDLIDRVEVIRGPSSSIYGSSAFFGVINVVTRGAGRIDGAEASVEAASADTWKARLSYGRHHGGLALSLSGTLYDSGGAGRLYYPEFDTPEEGDGVARNMDGDLAGNVLAGLHYGDFSLAAAWSVREKDVPTAAYETVFGDKRLRTTDGRYYAEAAYRHRFDSGTQLTGRLFYDRYFYRGDYPYDETEPGGPEQIVVYSDDNYADEAGIELQWTRALFERHTIVAGAEYRRDLNILQSTFTREPQDEVFRDRRDGWSAGLYVQDEIALLEALRLSAGLRYDRYHNFGERLSPRLAVIYSPGSTAFKLLYGEAYRAPNAYEMYLDAPGYSKPNPELDPETIRTLEAVVEHEMLSKLRASVSVYRYRIDDLIAERVDPEDGLRVFGNLEEVSAHGVELELEGRHARGLLARASYALQRAEDAQTGRRLDNSPAQLGKFELVLPLHKDYVHAGLQLQYNGRSRSFAGTDIGGFAIVNATLYAQQLRPSLDLSASVYNLLDREYAYSGSAAHRQAQIPQDGRSVRLKATYRF